jgi:cold shock CspA family protein
VQHAANGGSVTRYCGVISWWHPDHDYGRIRQDLGGDELHVHGNNLRSGEHVFAVGDKVTYRLGIQQRRSKRGDTNAIEARRVSLVTDTP